MVDYPHQNPTPVPEGDIWQQKPPTPLEQVIAATEEQKRLDRIMHPQADHFAEQQHLADEARDRFFSTGGLRPTARGVIDNRPNRPEADHFVDDGPCKHTGRRHYPQPHATRNSNELRTESDARAEVDRLRKEDPNGNFMIVPASPLGDLWVVAQRGQVAEVLDTARGNQKPTEQE